MRKPLSRRHLAMLQEMGVRIWSRPEHGHTTSAAPQKKAALKVAPQETSTTDLSASDMLPTTPSAFAASGFIPPTPQPHMPDPTAPKPESITTTSTTIRTAIASANWAQLEEAARACKNCPLHQKRKQIVFGKGEHTASIFILGEAPGAEEDAQGIPFVGKSGQLLGRMLQALSGGPKQPALPVYVANTLKCRPPVNRNPDASELAQCRPFWERQIALVQPKVILALGRFATQVLLDSDKPLGKLRGHLHQYQGIPVLVSYHPAYLLRNLSDKGKAWADLCLLRQQLETNTTTNI